MKLVKNKIRVVHYAQVPCEAFVVDVSNEREAFLIIEALANQHLFLFEKNIIPDYCNLLGVIIWNDDLDADEDGEKWMEYWNEAEQMEWDEFVTSYPNYINGRKEK